MLALALALFSPTPSHTAPLFAAPFLSFDTGVNPNFVAVGDLNGDGKPDLAVANGHDNTVSVLLGNADGTFAPRTDHGTGSAPTCVAIADLNGDGKADLVVVNSGSNTVSVFLGGGDGSFTVPSSYVTGATPNFVAIADLNADGKPDLVVADLGSSAVSVLLGNGDGTFAAKTDYPMTGAANGVAVGDLNRDGKPDLAVANGPSTVSVLLGNGNGTFGTRTDYATGFRPVSVAIGDLNSDGKLDLATANLSASTISVLLGNGDGTLGPKTDFATGPNPGFVAIGDLDGDGKPDLAVPNSGANTVSVLLGIGNGTFGARRDYPAVANPRCVAIADLNADGKLDLAVANSGSTNVGNTVTVLLGNGNGTFGLTSNLGTGVGPFSVAIGDFNRDGRLDLAVANLGGVTPGNTVSVLLGNGNGTFGPKTDYTTGTAPAAVAAGDLNGDGRLDLVVANLGTFLLPGNTVSVLLGIGDGTFGAKSDYVTGANPISVAIGDLNGDGKPDLAVANYGSTGAPGNTVSVLLGNGDGTFGPKSDYVTGANPISAAIGDLNRDGKPDLAVANFGPNSISVLLGNGNGTFGAKSDYVTANGPGFAAIGDLNGDGNPDLAAACEGPYPYFIGVVSVLLGHGDGTFGPKSDFPAGGGTAFVAIGDLNGDGKPDLAATNQRSSTVSVLLGNGDGTFGPKVDYGTGAGTSFAAIGDLNGDGRPDLAAANAGSNTVALLLNTGGLPWLGVESSPAPARANSLRLGPPQPNPSRGDTRLRFDLPAASLVEADLLDLAGRRVRSLDSGEELQPGEHMLFWDGRDDRGKPVPAGIYLVRVRAGREVAWRKLARLPG